MAIDPNASAPDVQTPATTEEIQAQINELLSQLQATNDPQVARDMSTKLAQLTAQLPSQPTPQQEAG